jgi:hypothetical protein
VRQLEADNKRLKAERERLKAEVVLRKLVAKGLVEIVGTDDRTGDKIWRLTEAGKKRAAG